MNILKYTSILSIFLFLCVNSFSEARVKYEASIKVKKDMNLVVDNKNGNIKIETWDSDTVELKAIKFSFSWGAKDEIDNVEIVPFQSGNDVVIETRYPDYLETGKVAVYYSIMIPDFINIKELQNSNGKIEINGGRGNCIISTSNGRIEVNDYEGDIEAYTSNGGIYLNNIFGNCSGTTSNARIKVINVEGDLDFKNSNAGVFFENITGNISAIADNGKISVSSSTGNMTLKTSFGSIEAFDSEGDLLLFSSFGKIQVENISGFVRAKTDNGSVKIIETSGIITAETTNG
ncbi:MAG TPA: hypothetical protein PLO89_11290, partial [Spirochaetota bacterium]|nr:hypothetical protein [Spirochaetota bacterium]